MSRFTDDYKFYKTVMIIGWILFLVLVIALAGCSTAPKPLPDTYECAILGSYGTLATFRGAYSSRSEALEDGEVIVKRMIELGYIQSEAQIVCKRLEEL